MAQKKYLFNFCKTEILLCFLSFFVIFEILNFLIHSILAKPISDVTIEVYNSNVWKLHQISSNIKFKEKCVNRNSHIDFSPISQIFIFVEVCCLILASSQRKFRKTSNF